MKDCFNRDINDNDLCLRFSKSDYFLCLYKDKKFYDENGDRVAIARTYKIANPDLDELEIKNSILEKVEDNKRIELMKKEYIKKNKIHAKQLQFGHAYITSDSELVIYLGKYKCTKLILAQNIDVTKLSIHEIYNMYKNNSLYCATALDYKIGYCYIPIYFLAYSFIDDCLIFEDKYVLENLALYNNTIDNYNYKNDKIELCEKRKVLVKHIDKYKVPAKDQFVHVIKGWQHNSNIFIYEREK